MIDAVARTQPEQLKPGTDTSPVAATPEALTAEAFRAHVDRAAEWQAAAALRGADLEPSKSEIKIADGVATTASSGLGVIAKGEALAAQAQEIATTRGYSNPATERLMALVRHHAVAENNSPQVTQAQGRTNEPKALAPEAPNSGISAADQDKGINAAARPIVRADNEDLLAKITPAEEVEPDEDGMVSIDTTRRVNAIAPSAIGSRFDYAPPAVEAPVTVTSSIFQAVPEPRTSLAPAESIASIAIPLVPPAAQPSLAVTTSTEPDSPIQTEAVTTSPANTFKLGANLPDGTSRQGRARFTVIPASNQSLAA